MTTGELVLVDDAFVFEAGTGRQLNVLDNDRELSGEIVPSSVTMVVAPSHADGWRIVGGGTIGYDAPADDDPAFSATDSFVYSACARDGRCGTATVTITIVGG